MPKTKNRLVGDTYMNLIRAFPLRRIANSREHAAAKKIVLELSTGHLDAGSRDYLGVLVDLMGDYEKRAGYELDTSRVSAVDLVRHRLEEKGLSVSALARQINMPQSNLSEMLASKRGWSKTAILALSEHLSIAAERFLKLQ